MSEIHKIINTMIKEHRDGIQAELKEKDETNNMNTMEVCMSAVYCHEHKIKALESLLLKIGEASGASNLTPDELQWRLEGIQIYDDYLQMSSECNHITPLEFVARLQSGRYLNSAREVLSRQPGGVKLETKDEMFKS